MSRAILTDDDAATLCNALRVSREACRKDAADLGEHSAASATSADQFDALLLKIESHDFFSYDGDE